MKKISLMILLVLSICKLNSQELPNVVPPSPEASALSQFVNVPVSYYTGLANISVPFYVIKQDNVEIPISLSYHARGVKVSEVAPRTGTGWSLTYGGSLSRQVRGVADDSADLSSYFHVLDRFRDIPYHEVTRETVFGGLYETHNGFDFYPDQFSFNGGNTSGKFIFDYGNFKPLVQSYDNTKVFFEQENGKLASFKVVDKSGTTYYYGVSKDGARTAREYQISVGTSVYLNGNQIRDPSGVSEINYSSWKLMDIETNTGKLISYYYEPENFIRYEKGVDRHSTDGSLNYAVNINDVNKIYSTVSRIDSKNFRLKEIVFNGGKVVFERSQSPREDYNGYSLERVKVYNDNNLVKSYKLNYEYTHSEDKEALLPYIVQNQITFSKSFKRLFLKSIEEEGSNNEKIKIRDFVYNDIVLPSRYSTKQDYWGYYNGVNNGPFLRDFNYGNYKPNRRVDPIQSEAGLLKEIKYPTGGKLKLTYEDNIGKAPTYANKVVLPKINPSAHTQVEHVWTKNDFTYSSSSGYLPKEITIPARTQISIKFDCFHLRDVNDTETPDCLFQLLYNGFDVAANITNNYTTSVNESQTNHTFKILTPRFPGIDPNLHRDRDFDFKVTVSYNIPDDYTNLYAGGKRIKKVEHITGEETITKEFEYQESNSTNSSGVINSLPSFLNKKEDTFGYLITGYYDSNGTFGMFQPNAIGYRKVTEYIGNKTESLGKSEYIFSNMIDTGGDFYEYPYHAPTDNEWLRGKLLTTNIYKRKEGNYSLVKSISNDYLYANYTIGVDNDYSDYYIFTPLMDRVSHVDDPHIPILELSTEDDLPEDKRRNVTNTFFHLPLYITKKLEFDNPNDYHYRIYYATGGTQHLWKTKETTYNDSGAVETNTVYQYDYNKHYQPKGSETTNSKGETLKSVNYYPTDKSVLSGLSDEAKTAIDSLQRRNRFEVIQTESYKNNVLQSTSRTNYKASEDPNNALVLPKEIQTLSGLPSATNELETRIVYHKYDAKGNPLEVSKVDGTHIVYIWGYDKTQPIAKIENATLADISEATIRDLQTKSDNDSNAASEATLRTALNSLRNIPSLSKALVTTYTYNPLIGVTSVTDPRGETMYYEYDGFNRLILIKNAQGNIVKEHRYNYKK